MPPHVVKYFCKVYSLLIEELYGVTIPPETVIGDNLILPHSGPITISPSSIIGNNVIIHPCTLIGGMRGKGFPIIGNNVFIGHGVKIIGNVKIGNDVFIAPGTIVVNDVEEGSTIVGCSMRQINKNGKEYVKRYL